MLLRKGYSVLEILKAAEVTFRTKIDYQIKPKREGDPAVLGKGTGSERNRCS